MGTEIRKNLTHYLYAHPSFIEGMGRIFDFAGNLQVYNESPSESQADEKALKNDWETVGQDLKTAINNFENGRK